MRVALRRFWIPLLLAFLLLIREAIAFTELGEVRGTYLLLSPEDLAYRERLERYLDSECLRGLSLRLHWRDLEPERGAYRWSELDRALALIEEKGKKVTIRVLGGFWAPGWIYQEGVAYLEVDISERKRWISEDFRKRYGDTLRLPKVWERKYLELWLEFLEAFGRRYSDRREIALVHLTGPTFFSAEPTLALTEEDVRLLISNGFNYEDLRRSWDEVFTVYGKLFPEKYLSFNVNYVLPGRLDLSEDLVNLARKRLGDRLVLGYNGLSPRHLFKRGDDPILLLLRSRGGLLGFQTVAPLSPMFKARGISERRARRFTRELIRFVREERALYLEIYPQDLNLFGC